MFFLSAIFSRALRDNIIGNPNNGVFMPLKLKTAIIWSVLPLVRLVISLPVSYTVRLNWVKENTHTTRLKNSGGQPLNQVITKAECVRCAFGADCAALACIP